MGTKYNITFTRNGNCPFSFDRQTNFLFIALWHLLVCSIKYPIVDFQIRKGYVDCKDCEADFCEKSNIFRKERVKNE